MKRVRASFVLAAGLILASCGGGGGGGSPPAAPPPPPPPPPTVVVANASGSAPSVHEGQPFWVDASASTVTNGPAPTFAWTQVSGPSVTIANANTAKLDLTAAEVTADAPAQFRVTVTSGAVTSQATVDVTFTNIAQTPVFATLTQAATATFNASFSNAVETILGNWTFGLVGTTTAAGGPITFAEFRQTGTQVVASPTAPFAQAFTQPVRFQLDAALPIGMTFDFDAPFFFVTEEAANRYRILRRTPGGSYTTTFMDRTITRPCATSYPIKSPSATLNRMVIVGQRTQGFSILSLDPAGSLYQEVNTGQSFCAITMAEAPINSTSSLFLGASPAIEDVIAIDTATNTINQFGSSAGDPTRYALKAQAQILLGATTPLNLVASTPVYSQGLLAGLALVYTDGQHIGQHRLVLVGLTSSGRGITQVLRGWTTGVPSDVIQDDLDGDGFPEIVIISADSPQAIVFETMSPTSTPIIASLTSLPSFVEIGLGATKALPMTANALSTGGMYVAYRNRNQVRLFTR